MPSPTNHKLFDHRRERSLGFLEWEDESWSCFLVSFIGNDQNWHGRIKFRLSRNTRSRQLTSVETANIFIEDSESEIDTKARGLGRPLLRSLLSSAIHKKQAAEERTTGLKRWFERNLNKEFENISNTAGEYLKNAADPDSFQLQSLYSSYKVDQLCHFISLMDPKAFEKTVDHILKGQKIDFKSDDQFQLSLIVLEYIETRIPIPPYSIWKEDFLSNREEYIRYSRAR